MDAVCVLLELGDGRNRSILCDFRALVFEFLNRARVRTAKKLSTSL